MKTTTQFLQHIFGAEYGRMMEWIRSILLEPDTKQAPLLLIGEHSSGKTLFLNWLNEITVQAQIVSPNDIFTPFPYYLGKPILLIDEVCENEIEKVVGFFKTDKIRVEKPGKAPEFLAQPYSVLATANSEFETVPAIFSVVRANKSDETDPYLLDKMMEEKQEFLDFIFNS